MLTSILLLATALVTRPAEAPHVVRAKVLNTEKLINTQLAALYPDEPWFLIGMARGVYLDGMGVVFSAEINLATGPYLSPFKQTISREEIVRLHDKKEVRLPLLRKRMVTIVGSMASYLETMPSNEEFVLAVSLLRYPWEDSTGIPSQIIMRAPRGKLMEAQRNNVRPASVLRIEEY